MKHKLYNRLLSLALAVGLVIGMLPSAAAVDTVGGSAGQAALNVSADNGLEMQKTVEPVAGTDDQFKITLEAWTTGEVTQGQPTPSDIVLVVDMSTSMNSQFSESAYRYVPVYGSNNLDKNSTYYAGDSHTEVTWCDRCDAWTNGCWNFFGHHPGIKYTPKNNESDQTQGRVQFYTRKTVSSMTRLEALQQAANAFIAQVAEQSTDDRIAIVGFGQGAYYLTGNNANNAFYDATTYEQNLQSVISSIGTNSHSLESATEHGKGLANTVEIFKANNNPNRNKIVVVITDGEPAPKSTDNWSSRVVKQAIDNAYTLKNTYHAQIYSVSVMPGTNAANPTQPMDKYMSYISSNYPNAQYTGRNLDNKNNSGNTYYSNGGSTYGQNEILSQVTPGSKAQDGNYYLTASNIEELEKIFGDIGDQIETPKIDLDETAVLQDEVTKYFVAPDSVSEVTVQTDNYNGTAFENNPTTLSGASVTFDGNTVKVSGFNYSDNFISDTQKLDGTYGKKLIVSFVVQAHSEFWGGNKVPTNVEETSGIYNGAGDLVENFVQPDPVDVPLKKIALTDKNVNVYYGGATPDAAGLVNQITFPDNWRTDYVNAITYSVNNTVSNTADGAYTVTATLSPLYTGKYDSNTATANANVNVFKPEITWQDSTRVKGTVLSASLLNSHNTLVRWMHGTTADTEVPMFEGSAPQLTYSFADAAGKDLTNEALQEELDVSVKVTANGQDITAAVTPKWEAGYGCADTETAPANAQFRIHTYDVTTDGMTITKEWTDNDGDALSADAYKDYQVRLTVEQYYQTPNSAGGVDITIVPDSQESVVLTSQNNWTADYTKTVYDYTYFRVTKEEISTNGGETWEEITDGKYGDWTLDVDYSRGEIDFTTTTGTAFSNGQLPANIPGDSVIVLHASGNSYFNGTKSFYVWHRYADMLSDAEKQKIVDLLHEKFKGQAPSTLEECVFTNVMDTGTGITMSDAGDGSLNISFRASSIWSKGGYCPLEYTQGVSSMTATNKLDTESKIDSIPVKKVWADDSGSKQSDVTVTLSNNGEVVDTVTLGQSNSWKGAFEDVPKYNADGTLITYTADDVQESKVEGYTTSITGDMTTGFTITNTREVGSLTITKTVEGLENDPNTLAILKNQLKFTVTGPNNYSEEIAFNATGWEQAGNTYTYTIDDLPTGAYTVEETKYELTEYGYNWTGTESPVEGTVNNDGSVTVPFTNTYTPANINLTITKQIQGDPYGDGRDMFSFRITCIDCADDTNIGKVWYVHINGEGSKTITLPVGKYEVEELSNMHYEFVKVEPAPEILTPTTRAIEYYGYNLIEDETITFTNEPVTSNIPSDGGGVENHFDKYEDGKIVWKPEEYGDDGEIQPKPTPEPSGE